MPWAFCLLSVRGGRCGQPRAAHHAARRLDHRGRGRRLDRRLPRAALDEARHRRPLQRGLRRLQHHEPRHDERHGPRPRGTRRLAHRRHLRRQRHLRDAPHMVLLHRVARRDPPPPRHERLGRRHAKHHGAYHSAPRPPLRDAALRARVRLHAHVAQRRHALCAHPDVQLQPHQRRGRAGGEGTEDLHRRHARRRPGRRRIRHGQLRRRPPPEHDRLRADGRGLAQRGRGALPRPRELHHHERPRRRHGHRRRSHARHDHPAPEHGRHAGVRRQPRELRALRRHVRLRRAEHLRRQPHDHAHAVHPGRLRRTDAHRLRTRQRRRQRPRTTSPPRSSDSTSSSTASTRKASAPTASTRTSTPWTTTCSSAASGASRTTWSCARKAATCSTCGFRWTPSPTTPRSSAYRSAHAARPSSSTCRT